MNTYSSATSVSAGHDLRRYVLEAYSHKNYSGCCIPDVQSKNVICSNQGRQRTTVSGEACHHAGPLDDGISHGFIKANITHAIDDWQHHAQNRLSTDSNYANQSDCWEKLASHTRLLYAPSNHEIIAQSGPNKSTMSSYINGGKHVTELSSSKKETSPTTNDSSVKVGTAFDVIDEQYRERIRRRLNALMGTSNRKQSLIPESNKEFGARDHQYGQVQERVSETETNLLNDIDESACIKLPCCHSISTAAHAECHKRGKSGTDMLNRKSRNMTSSSCTNILEDSWMPSNYIKMKPIQEAVFDATNDVFLILKGCVHGPWGCLGPGETFAKPSWMSDLKQVTCPLSINKFDETQAHTRQVDSSAGKDKAVKHPRKAAADSDQTESLNEQAHQQFPLPASSMKDIGNSAICTDRFLASMPKLALCTQMDVCPTGGSRIHSGPGGCILVAFGASAQSSVLLPAAKYFSDSNASHFQASLNVKTIPPPAGGSVEQIHIGRTANILADAFFAAICLPIRIDSQALNQASRDATLLLSAGSAVAEQYLDTPSYAVLPMTEANVQLKYSSNELENDNDHFSFHLKCHTAVKNPRKTQTMLDRKQDKQQSGQNGVNDALPYETVKDNGDADNAFTERVTLSLRSLCRSQNTDHAVENEIRLLCPSAVRRLALKDKLISDNGTSNSGHEAMLISNALVGTASEGWENRSPKLCLDDETAMPFALYLVAAKSASHKVHSCSKTSNIDTPCTNAGILTVANASLRAFEAMLVCWGQQRDDSKAVHWTPKSSWLKQSQKETRKIFTAVEDRCLGFFRLEQEILQIVSALITFAQCMEQLQIMEETMPIKALEEIFERMSASHSGQKGNTSFVWSQKDRAAVFRNGCKLVKRDVVKLIDTLQLCIREGHHLRSPAEQSCGASMQPSTGIFKDALSCWGNISAFVAGTPEALTALLKPVIMQSDPAAHMQNNIVSRLHECAVHFPVWIWRKVSKSLQNIQEIFEACGFMPTENPAFFSELHMLTKRNSRACKVSSTCAGLLTLLGPLTSLNMSCRLGIQFPQSHNLYGLRVDAASLLLTPGRALIRSDKLPVVKGALSAGDDVLMQAHLHQGNSAGENLGKYGSQNASVHMLSDGLLVHLINQSGGPSSNSSSLRATEIQQEVQWECTWICFQDVMVTVRVHKHDHSRHPNSCVDPLQGVDLMGHGKKTSRMGRNQTRLPALLVVDIDLPHPQDCFHFIFGSSQDADDWLSCLQSLPGIS